MKKNIRYLIIMLAVLFPVTRIVVGTAIGTKSIIFPLVISAFPYIEGKG